jgi:hypothetical protein
MMRLCLEYAGYALAIFADSAGHGAQEIFLNRHANDAGMKAQKEEFKISNIREIISTFDPGLSIIFKALYDRTIDFGGHPNPLATLNAAKFEKPQEHVSGGIAALALTVEDLPLRHAMKTTAQVGSTALYIFQHILKAKFELLGIRAEMDALRREHL